MLCFLVYQHHLVEDTGIVLGQVFDRALKKRTGIARAGYSIFPMDEALALVAIDLSGRPYLRWVEVITVVLSIRF